MLKKILYIAAWIVELAALVGADTLDHFGRAKLGMNRWLVFHNTAWEESLPIAALEVACVVLLLVLLALTVAVVLKRRSATALFAVEAVLSLCCIVVFSFFMLNNSAELNHAFYLMSACYALGCLVQVVKTAGVGLLPHKRA